MKRSLIDDFFITKKEEWQEGFEGRYRRSLEELLQLLKGDLKGSNVEEYLKRESLFVSEKFLIYILKNRIIEGRFKSNAKRALSFIKTRQNTPLLAAGMNGERGSRGCNPLERGFQRGCRPLWSRSGLMPRPRRRALRASEAPCGVRVYYVKGYNLKVLR